MFSVLGAVDWRRRVPAVEQAYGGFRADDLYPDALRALAGLRDAGYRLAVVANQPDIRGEQLRRIGVDVEVMAMSDGLGVAKPDAAFYARTLELMGDPSPASVAYVGDRVDNDVLPSMAAGMRAVWLRRGPWGVIQRLPDGTHPALTVGSLDELGRAHRGGLADRRVPSPTMDAPRLTVALTIDHDAISDSIRRGDSPVKFSHAEFGPRVGAKRILELLASRAIPATWFVPGHTLTTFTDDTDAILAGGHELACHGWFHEDFAELGVDQTREVLGRSVEAVRAVTGAAPAGFRAPYWSLGSADARAGRGGRFRLRQLAHGERLRPLPGPPRRSPLDGWTARSGARRAGSSRCRSTGRWTTGRISSPVRAGRGCRRRRPSSRSGPRSCATPTSTPRAAW